MGCGQSNIYSKNKKNKNNTANKNDSIRSASIDQKNGNAKSNKTNNNGAEVNRNEDQNSTIDIKSQAKKKTGGPGSGPLLQQAEVSSSQLDFFRMLDEKIENGPDYDETVDATVRAERVSDLLRQWELASMTWTSVTDLSNPSTVSITNKDREGMRNIIGGRPESAPIFTRNVNRMDGLEEIHCPSPSMPRHVLESITQSPTQSFKHPTPPGGSPMTQHYQDYNKEDNTNITRMNRNQQNSDYLGQQALYHREQYLQQTGIISVQPQCQSNNVLRSTPYVSQFQITTNPQHYQAPRKRGFNSAQMT